MQLAAYSGHLCLVARRLAFVGLLATLLGVSSNSALGERAEIEVSEPELPPSRCSAKIEPLGLVPGVSDSNCQGEVMEAAAAAGAAGAVPGSISGTVTEEGTGVPLVDACVFAINQLGDISIAVRTSGDGTYLMNVAPGTYNIWFNDCGGSPEYYVPEWYDNLPASAIPDDLGVADGEARAGIDASLSAGGGEINGTVATDVGGQQIEGVCVLAVNAFLGVVGISFTDTNGAFAMQGVPSGVRLFFVDCFEPRTHVPEWWQDAVEFDDADLINVAAGAKQSIDVGMAVGASINGSVTATESGLAVAGICVDAFDDAGLFRGSALVDTTGAYTLGGLGPGLHRVRFRDCDSPLVRITEWYNNRANFASADRITIGGPGSKLSGINGSLALGGSMQGRVYEVDSYELLAGFCISVFNIANDFVLGAVSGSAGFFEIGGLAPAQYKVLFFDCRAVPEYVRSWYYNEISADRATRISVTAGASAEVAGYLAKGGVVNGTVRGAVGGQPIEGICVYADDLSQNTRGFDVSDSDGRYRIPLPQQGHKILFFDCRDVPAFNPQWYDREQDPAQADVVQIGGVGSKASGRDGFLTLHIPGDVDCNWSITSIDALLVLQIITGLIPELECQYNSDPDDDGFITSVDAVLILQLVAGLIPAL